MTDKMKFETPNLTTENVAKIAALFPGAVAEGKVNIDLLRAMLGEDLFADEAYEFTWVGKHAAIAEAGRPIRKTLRPCIEESKNWDTTENLYIEGDNLDVLKLLQESYLGKVKMIYIDPPYNTGSDFIYRDDFAQSREEYDEEAGVYDENGDRLFRNTETNGRFHSDWCSMIYPRLVLAKQLLSNDGLIFISIGDDEVNNLRKICDEAFGESNFRNQIVVRRGAKSVQAQFETWDKLGQGLEYILLYSRNQTYRFPRQMKQLEDEREGAWNNHWRGTDRPTMRYPLFGITPESGQWRWGKERSEKAIENYRRMLSELKVSEEEMTLIQIDEWYVKQQDNSLDLLRLSKNGKPEHYIAPTNTTLLNSSWVDLLVGSSSEISALFDTKVFDTAKLTPVIMRMLQFVPTDSIIMDFFSGSATTAHAVMQLNAEDGGKRKFIMVQLPEPCAPDSEAAKADYSNICEIGKERIRRAGDKIKVTNPLGTIDLDTGFRVLKLADTNMNDVYYAAGDYTQEMISLMESNIKPDRTDMDLLFGCLLDWGLPLSMPHIHEQIDGFTVHTYNSGDLIACFEERIGEKAVREIASRQPLRAVFRDSGFSSSPEKINVFEIFKLLAPNTTVRVI
ncbi:MAG: site-specific DNA-methyltransferase [Dethiobacter sp.]|jgi:adenine-specific DNA-methyltransferase|nr:site-specific DNA-methyltransferase [Dethiobacter sp.]MBS3901246.1 site-specific DNA-methyltransferase [Dethiobacter sp.]MBS3988834.1 site-specific DNA-methyltransferase [Dethiobacter sp.]